MIAKLKVRTLLLAALFSAACVDGYGASDYEEDDESADEDDDNTGVTGNPDGGTDSGAKADAGKSNDSGTPDAGNKADAGPSADAGKGVDAGGDAGKDGGGSDAGASCDTLTYEAFGQQFMTSFCIGCHGPTAQRGNVRLDTLANVVMKKAGVKTNVLNGNMPQGAKKPNEVERQKLGQWIDCGPN